MTEATTGLAYPLRARLDLHVLVSAPQVPDLVEALDLRGITAILNSSGLTGRSLEAGHAFTDPKAVNTKLPEPSTTSTRQPSKRPEEVAILADLEGLSYDWTRNPLTVADTLSVTIHADDVPFDLRLLKGAQVRGWLYCHGDSKACRPGDPGYFGGVVDFAERDRNAARAMIECRDYTAFPLNHKLSAKTLAGVDLAQTLPEIVRYLIDLMPGGNRWWIEGRGKVAKFGAPASLLAEERVRVVRKRQKQLVYALDLSKGLVDKRAYALEDPGKPSLTLYDATSGEKVISESEIGATFGEQRPTYISRLPYIYSDDSQENDAGGTWTEITTPAKVRTVKVPPSAQTIFGSSETSTWDAIVRICALMGCLPEVAFRPDGSVGIVIVAADELHGGGVLRSFERTVDGQLLRHRVLVDGEDIDDLTERRELEAGAKVDAVELHAADPDTGRTRRARFGRFGPEEGVDLIDATRAKGLKTKGKRRVPYGITQGRVAFMTAHGITNQAHLERLARTAWLSLTSGAFKLGINAKAPWSNGGGVGDPDLLELAAGAVVELRFTGLESVGAGLRAKAARQGADVSQAQAYYEARGVDPAAAKVLGDATLHASLPLVFQVGEVKHSFDGSGDGSYACAISAQGFILDDEAPDLDEDEWRKAQDDAFEAEQETTDEVYEEASP